MKVHSWGGVSFIVVFSCLSACSKTNGAGPAPVDGGSEATAADTSPPDQAAPDAASGSDDWPMYGLDAHHSFAKLGAAITKSNVTQLTKAWTFAAGDTVSASPTIVGGVVYIGSWDGYFYALDVATGTQKWKFELDCQSTVLPLPKQCLADGQAPPDRTATDGGMITSTALVTGGRVYFGGGKTLYALDATDGSLVWKTVICGNPDAMSCKTDPNDPTQIYSSPTLIGGNLLIGHTVDGTTGYRGGIAAVDASTGAVAWTFEVDPMLDASGKVIGAYNRGCGNVWSSFGYDEINDLAIVGTADCQAAAPPPYSEAVLGLDPSTGAVKWTFRPRASDPDMCDFDIGASPNIFDLGGTRYVGIGSKDGTYYVLTSSNGKLAWSNNVVFGGGSGGFIGTAAFDGEHIYGQTAFGELGGMPCDPSDPRDMQIEEPSYHAFNALDGGLVWEDTKSYGFGASTVVTGVVFNGVGAPLTPELRVYDTSNGALLKSFPAGGAVNSSAAISGKMLIFGAGDSFDATGAEVIAYTLP